MRQVTRKAAATIGLGAALVAAAAGSASAAGTGNAGLLNPQLPGTPAQQGGLGQTFPVERSGQQIPTDLITSTLQSASEQSVPAAQQSVPKLDLPLVPGGIGG